MKFTNPTGRTLTEIQNNLSFHYPDIKIRKVFFNAFGPQHLLVPSGAMKHVIRPAKKQHRADYRFYSAGIDHRCSPAGKHRCRFIGSYIAFESTRIWRCRWPGICTVVPFAKSHLQIGEQGKFEKFHTDLELALTRSNHPDSIF